MSRDGWLDGADDGLRTQSDLIDGARHRARLRHARESLDRLEEIRDVALLRSVEDLESVARFLGLDVRYVERTDRLLELWAASGRDPFDHLPDELVKAALVDSGMDDVVARRRLVRALCTATADLPRPGSGELTAGGEAGSQLQDPHADVMLGVWGELERLADDGMLTRAELDEVRAAHRGATTD